MKTNRNSTASSRKIPNTSDGGNPEASLQRAMGLILVSTPEHVDRHEILDFLANFALRQNFYSEFSAELVSSRTLRWNSAD